MRILHHAGDLRAAGRKICLALGMFDGVHLGHQRVIRQTLDDADRHGGVAVVTTFDRHPSVVVAPDRVPPLIYTLPQKLRAIAALNVEAVLLLHFDEAFSRQPAGEFVHRLARELGRLQSISVGANFVFGFRRSGDVALLRRLGEELHFDVHGLPAVSLDGRVVSSTQIREAIRGGQLELAGRMLGRPYALAGPVVAGAQRGRKLGFPTANLDTAGLVLPPAGVYAVRARVADATHDAVLNLGWRPTVGQPAPQPTVEVHLLDFDGDLYGRELEVTFAARLRDERKFPDLEALRSQIAADIKAARGWFETRS